MAGLGSGVRSPVRVERLSGPAVEGALEDLARLRVQVFRAFPYLYDGDPANEAHYMRSYRDNPRAVLIVARDGARIVGAATAMPLGDHGDATQMTGTLPPADQIFYCAESVLLPEYRGQGIGHAFFDHRETEARMQGFAYTLFCGVIRPADHPLRPQGYRPLDAFWRKRGYAPVPGVTASFDWTDVDQTQQSSHILQAWMRRL